MTDIHHTEVLEAFAREEGDIHERLDVFEEHGGQFVVCLDCGAGWGVSRGVRRDGEWYVVLDPLDHGDGTCGEVQP